MGGSDRYEIAAAALSRKHGSASPAPCHLLESYPVSTTVTGKARLIPPVPAVAIIRQRRRRARLRRVPGRPPEGRRPSKREAFPAGAPPGIAV